MTDQPQESTLDANLWRAIKSARDAAQQRAMRAELEVNDFNILLRHMRAAGMARHIPTIEEVQEAWAAVKDTHHD